MDKTDNKIAKAFDNLYLGIENGTLLVEPNSLSPEEVVAKDTAKRFYNERKSWNDIARYSFFRLIHPVDL